MYDKGEKEGKDGYVVRGVGFEPTQAYASGSSARPL